MDWLDDGLLNQEAERFVQTGRVGVWRKGVEFFAELGKRGWFFEDEPHGHGDASDLFGFRTALQQDDLVVSQTVKPSRGPPVKDGLGIR